MKSYFNKIVAVTMLLVCTLGVQVFATTNDAPYGQNFATWALNQLFWIVVVALAISLIGCIIKRNITGLIVTLLVGVLVIAIISDPTGLKSIGENIWGVILGK